MYCRVTPALLTTPACEPWLFNYGGPSSRTRREKIESSLLGNVSKRSVFPHRTRVGLVFQPGVSPFELVNQLLLRCGYRYPEELRAELVLPQTLMAVYPIDDDRVPFLDAQTGSSQAVLTQAILLGLCGATFYDPARPIIWTDHRLSRKLDLFAVGDFYASD